MPQPAWIAEIKNNSAQPFTVDVNAPSQVRRIRVSGSSSAATLRVAGGTTLSASESVTVLAGGMLDLAGTGAQLNSPQVDIFPNGRLVGVGAITGDLLNNSGTISPGGAAAVGSLQVGGESTQTVSGSLDIDLAGATVSAIGSWSPAARGSAGSCDCSLRRARRQPLPGNTYEVMSFLASTGDFSGSEQHGFPGAALHRGEHGDNAFDSTQHSPAMPTSTRSSISVTSRAGRQL